jgi:hypothetical protein
MEALMLGRREALIASLFLGSAATLAAGAVGAADSGPIAPTGDVHDFDYQVGTWDAVQRRLKKRWTANPEWEEFPSRSTYVQYLGGAVSVDQTDFPTRGTAGMTVRVFDAEKRQWLIYWVTSKSPEMGTPVIGGYQGNRGLFYGDDTDDGRPIKVRFIRTKNPPDKERWEQAFSLDNGQSWEINWTADFTRVRA